MKNNKIKTPLIYTIEMNKAQAIRLAAYGTILMFLGAQLFTALTGSKYSLGTNPIISLVVYFVAMAAHEAVHGFFFKVFGGNPKYGVGLMYYFFPYAYATSPGQPYTMRQMFVIGISPLFVICFISLAIAAVAPQLTPYAAIAFIGNFAGAIGDIWLMRQILRFTRVQGLVFVDQKNGIAVYGRGEESKAIITKLKRMDNPNSRSAQVTKAWITSAALMILLSVLVPIVLALIGFHGHILIGPSNFPLFEYISSGKTNSFQLGLLPIIAASLIYAVLYNGMRHTKTAQS